MPDFEKISGTDYSIGISNRLPEILSRHERGSIEKIFNGRASIHYRNETNLTINLGREQDVVFVYKTSDEWFYIKKNPAHYKCDQLLGLIECLEEISNQTG